MALKYQLVVLTHGNSETLGATVRSFCEMVMPRPEKVVEHADGTDAITRDLYTDLWPSADLRFSRAIPSVGFCGATRRAWQMAIEPGPEYVFWLEHDFSFKRLLDLWPLARVLDANPQLAQMSLMRNAVNEEEKAAGGVFERHAERWTQRFSNYETGASSYPWLEHDICLTTNPSLMKREFMQKNPWPDYPSQCEGRFSEDLRQRGYLFGTWGSGEVYVEHTGKLRTGHSY